MNVTHTQGNDKLIERLDRMIRSNRISHAYIFEGSECIDKKAFAENFAKGILCPVNEGDGCGRCGICSKIDHGNHEDVMYVSASGRSIKDADIAAMQESLKTKPFGDRHVVIVENADTMTLRAQNRLLKTLEEPPGKSVIIMLSENMESLTPTIQSRCVKYRLNYAGSENYEQMMSAAEKIGGMLLRREPFYKVKKEADAVLGSDSEVSGFLDGLQVFFRNMLINDKKGISLYKDEDIIAYIHAVERARKQIKDGVSPVYAVRNLIIKIGG